MSESRLTGRPRTVLPLRSTLVIALLALVITGCDEVGAQRESDDPTGLIDTSAISNPAPGDAAPRVGETGPPPSPPSVGGFVRPVVISDREQSASSNGLALIDVDGDGATEALTDGLLILRHLFGFTGASLTNGAVGGACIRCDAASIEAALLAARQSGFFDIDGNGSASALTDGLLLLRYQFGFTGDALTRGAVSNDCVRCDATSIEAELARLSDPDENEIDTTPPVISLVGDAEVTHVQGTAYVDAGATAVDLVDGVVAVSVSGSVPDIVGVYLLSFSATDAAGNTSMATRTVNVVADPDPPEAGNLDVFQAGSVGALWNRGISAFDAAIGFADCRNDGGAGCPSIAWEVVSDDERGDVLQITHAASGDFAGLFIAVDGVVDLSDYADGNIEFDVRVISGDDKITMKLDCIFPCTSGDMPLGSRGGSGWESVSVSMASLVAGGLDITRVNTGLVIWATDTTSTVFRIDNVRFTGIRDGATPPTGPADPDAPVDFELLSFGAGSVSDTVNPQSYLCVFDFGNFIFNAGVTLPAIGGCDLSGGSPGTPQGEPTPVFPQLTGPAAAQPTMTHRWWGSVSFLGEMTVGDPSDVAYITPDPIIARVTERGARIAGIPAGLRTSGDGFLYAIPDPFAEVFDGIAVGNSDFSNLEAFLKDFSDGSVTVEWQDGGVAVMEATFVHGSPYVYFKAHAGDLVIRTLRPDGGEKGTFYQQNNSLGVWTSVAGNHNTFLITGEGATTFTGVTGSEITVQNAAKELTITWLPQASGVPADSLSAFFEGFARNEVAAVNVGYSVDRSTNAVTVQHDYVDALGAPVQTLAGMQPLHWKNSTQVTTAHQVRSARGITRFAQTSSFGYELDYVGVLPSLPTIDGSLDLATFTALADEYVAEGPAGWNPHSDTYFSGKHYGKAAEFVAIAEALGLTAQAGELRDWLRGELEDWFNADTNGSLDSTAYFVFDENWNTLLGFDESFASHQMLNDHHFHYGYFVRAAAEICRTDPNWCGPEQYGPMIELLIRDYAADRDDPMFPYLRHFDPANGFSWASGSVNFARGNNNESTSEAANAYGAMVLYGLATGNDALTERGMYLHASTAATFHEYWANLDGFRSPNTDVDNFPADYNRIATSIIWGDGTAFATFFSGAFAHILGIQILPSTPLMLHVGVDPEYLADYVALGLEQSSNGMPSGLPSDQWSDLWWNTLSLTDPAAALADYETVVNYTPEAGESKAHTYHWLHTMAELGQVQTGTGTLTADYPAAMVFENNGVTTYVVYNFDATARTVRFSDGQVVNAAPGEFTLISN